MPLHGLSDRRRLAVLALIMAGVVAAVTAGSIALLYQAHFERQRIHLAETAQSQARLIEAIARFEAIRIREDVPGGAAAATLSQIAAAHERYRGFGEPGDFTLARREGDMIVFLLSHNHHGLDTPRPVPFESELAEAMRRALQGQSGTMVGLDYRGVPVLAAYEPVAVLDLGLVAKIDMAEVRAPFIEAGAASGLGASFLVLLGVLLVRRIGAPLIEHLEATVSRLDNAQRIARLGNWDWDIVNNELRVSEATCRIFGVEPHAFGSYEAFLQCVHPDDRELVKDAVGKALYENAPYSIDYRVVHSDGRERTIHAQGEVKFDAAGKPIRMSGTVQDITERKRAERAVRESEEKYRALYDHNPSMYFTVDVEGTILSVNQFGASHLGYAVEELVGSSVLELFAGDFKSYARDQLNECLSEPESLHRWEIQKVRKDGTPLWVDETARVVRDPEGKPNVLVVCEDITERKRADESLHAWRRREAAIFDIAEEAIVSVDRDQRITLFNKGAEKTFGYAAEEVLGRSLDLLLPARVREAHRRHVHEFEVSGKAVRSLAQRGDIVGRRKDGTEFPADASVSQVEINGDKMFTAILRDVTERKKAETALRRSEASLANAQRIARLGNWDWNIETNELYCSDEVYRIFGVKPEDFGSYEAFLRCVHPDDRKTVNDAVNKALDEKARYSIDYRIVVQAGQQRTVHAQGEVKFDAAGNLVRMSGTVQDITDRKRAEEALRDSEETFRTAFETAAHGMALVSPDGKWLKVNRSLCEITGYGEEELLATDFQSITHPDDLEMDLENLRLLVDGEINSCVREKRYLHKQGRVVWILLSASLVRGPDSKPLFFVSHIQDITERKKAETALRRSEASLANAQRIARLGNWDWDMLTNELHWSDEIYRIYGLKRQGLVPAYDTFLQFVHPDDRDRMEESANRALDEKAPYSVDFRLVLPDGRERTVHEEAEVEFDDSGKPVRMTGIMHDITDRKRAEMDLSVRARQQRAVAEIGQRALANGGLEPLFRNATALVAKTLGVEFCKVLEFLPAGNALLLRAGVGWKKECVGSAMVSARRESQAGYTLLSRGPVIVEDLRAETRFSGPALLHDHGVVSGMSVIIGEPERPFGVLGAHSGTRRAFTRDDANFLQAGANVLAAAIERAQAEEKVHTLSRAIEQSPSLVIVTDTEGAIEYVNPRFTEVTGYAASELIGKSPGILRSGHTSPEEYKRLWQTITSGGTWRGEFHDRKKNGEFFWAATVISPVHAPDGTISHFIGVIEDVTERRRREAEVIQASKLATLGEMTTAVAHELNQPLSVIRMAAERVIDRLESGEVDRGFLSERMERIAAQIERAGTIIDHMRIFGRPAGEEKTRFDPRVAVEKALSLMGEQLRLRNIEVRTGVPETCLPVIGNEVQLEQVLLNLLANARDAIEARAGPIDGEGVLARVIDIKVTCSHAKKRVQISVRDTGGGIPESLINRVFEPFVTTKEEGKGTGLGLSVSRDIVTGMGGTIRARNVVGGAEFTITLPATEPVELLATERRAKRESCPRPKAARSGPTLSRDRAATSARNG